MKKPLTILFLVLAICLNSKATNYYIAASGNDANNGTSTTSPWKTLNKLNSYFSSLRPGDNVYLNRGDVFYGSITVNKSGSSGSPITIGAYGSGAQPVITGFTTVTSWTNLGSNIWESSSAVSSLSTCNMVTVNGVNTAMGRYPNLGYLTYEYFTGNYNINSSSLGATNWTGAEAVIKKSDYTLDRCIVTNQSGTVITYTDPYSTSDANWGYGFFIQNDVRTLDQQNEWYYNPSTKKIRVYSSGTPQNVQVASLSNLFYDDGFDYITVDNITFSGSSQDAVYFSNSSTDYCNVQNCTVSFAGRNGVFNTAGSNCNITNNVIHDCNSTGIESDAGSNNSIESNRLNSMGVLIGQSTKYNTGIFAASKNVVIRYNSVVKCGYIGILLGSAVGTGLVQYNFIDSSGLVLDDGGGIYTGSVQKGGVRTIDHNIVLNTFGCREGTSNTTRSLSAGIYCDDLSSDVVVTNNSVANSVNAGIKMHRANNCIVNNNTVYNSGRDQIYYQNNSSTSDIYANTQKNNIFFAKTYSSSSNYQWVFACESPNNDIGNFLSVSDSNYFVRPVDSKSQMNIFQPNTTIHGTLAAWQAFSGKDVHSKSSPITITDTNNLRFEYNASSSNKTINLGAAYIDSKNASYNGFITLAPYSSAALIKTGASTANQSPTANAGSDKTITLPSTTVSLSGSGTDPDGTISAYNWIKISGPSATITNAASAATTVTALVQGVYQFQLTVTDNAGATGQDTVQVTVNPAGNLLPAINPTNIVNGLDYAYYEGSYSAVPVFSTLSAVKTGAGSSFDITLANRTTQFAFNFTGFIKVPSDGQYTFYTNSDDGSNLFIDGVLVVNNDGLHASLEKSGVISLAAGIHSISVGFFQQGGGDVLNVSYDGPGISKQAIPASALYRYSTANTVNGLNYSYYEGSYTNVPVFSALTPVKSGTSSTFDITVANRNDQFAFNFTGFISIPTTGQYTFYTNSDDGSNLYIDGMLVVNNDGLHTPLEKSGTISLSAGMHSISVGFFEQSGGQVLTVSYEGPGISKQVIPASVLFGNSTTSSTLNGLNYSYYEASYTSVPVFSGLTPVKSGTSSTFDITLANRNDQFAFNFTGFISIPTTGQYTFYTNSDDGSNLYIDGMLVVNNDGLHTPLEKSGTISLSAGMHSISVGFFEQSGGQVLTVSYEGAGISKQVIPTSVLFTSGTSGNNAIAIGNNINPTIASSSSAISIQAYPNPFANSIKVSINGDAGNYKLILVDVSGKIIFTKVGVKNAGTIEQSINTSALQRGIYFLRVMQANNSSTVIKLVK